MTLMTEDEARTYIIGEEIIAQIAQLRIRRSDHIWIGQGHVLYIKLNGEGY